MEVAWKGKFRLESADIYQGSAWWVAQIVDKHSSQQKYKIKYPGWDNRWDEWVPRCRLRWAVDKNVVEQICVEEPVEIWCCGATVPGAWLVSHVTEVRGDQYCVGNVLASGEGLWVTRSRMRPAKRETKAPRSEIGDLDGPERAGLPRDAEASFGGSLMLLTIPLSRMSPVRRSVGSPGSRHDQRLPSPRTAGDQPGCCMM